MITDSSSNSTEKKNYLLFNTHLYLNVQYLLFILILFYMGVIQTLLPVPQHVL